MRIATWNVNSLRARLPRVLEWMAAWRPDVLCLQETKVPDALFPLEAFRERGWHAAFHGQKTYNGVAILSRTEPSEVEPGLSDPDLDGEARLLRASVQAVRIVSAYVPNGQEVGSAKFAFKLRWMEGLRRLLAGELDRGSSLVACGDFNVAPEERDVHDPQRWRGQVLFSGEERAALSRLLETGLQDALRLVTSEGGLYTWWDYRAGAFHRGWGLRIDHILVDRRMAARLEAVSIDRDARKGKAPSDHAPVVADFAEEVSGRAAS